MGLFSDLMKTPVPEIQPDTPHYEAVGRFVTSYATAEAAVHMLARHLSGLSDEKARIIFGGMRLPDLADIVRHFMRIDNLPSETKTQIEGCLNQLVLISKRRHSLVHRSSHMFDGRLLVTNLLTTKSLKAIEHESFEVKELSAMQSDCSTIYFRLTKLCKPGNEPIFDDELLESFIVRRPWRYKHAPPKTPNLKPRAKSAKPRPQPPSSKEKQRE